MPQRQMHCLSPYFTTRPQNSPSPSFRKHSRGYRCATAHCVFSHCLFRPLVNYLEIICPELMSTMCAKVYLPIKKKKVCKQSGSPRTSRSRLSPSPHRGPGSQTQVTRFEDKHPYPAHTCTGQWVCYMHTEPKQEPEPTGTRELLEVGPRNQTWVPCKSSERS